MKIVFPVYLRKLRINVIFFGNISDGLKNVFILLRKLFLLNLKHGRFRNFPTACLVCYRQKLNIFTGLSQILILFYHNLSIAETRGRHTA